ncbi:GvpL/GvpF family gas vesicle protein [Streptomyces racemochromogenes]|uniref:GvpL/GvpF family gas vesicle protein n=1 Tax=Streptomyces racemochromogenes TaxID=67353 RepID=A0ABW7PDD0_9ACTN
MSGPGLLYVYAVLDARAGAPDLTGVEGAGGPGPTVLGDGVLAAVVEPVDAALFEEEALRRRLEDLAWLSWLARAHHRVVAAAGDARTAVPLRLATVCRGEAGVRGLLLDGRDRLQAALARLEGSEEWGVKLYAAATRPGAPAPDGQPGTDAPSGDERPGRDYLRRRLGERRRQQDHIAVAAAIAREVHDRLAARSAGAVLHPAQRPQLSGTSDAHVLNAAYLVRRNERARFLDGVPAAGDLGGGMRVELTGPWVPYSFTRLGDEPGGRR